jgi:hypothetical protein
MFKIFVFFTCPLFLCLLKILDNIKDKSEAVPDEHGISIMCPLHSIALPTPQFFGFCPEYSGEKSLLANQTVNTCCLSR